MNTQNKKTIVRSAKFCATLAIATLLAGCVVTSVYPYFTEKDLVFEPALVGDWIDVPDESAVAFLRIEKFGDGYLFTTVSESETNSLEAHLFKLRKQLFLDTCVTNRSLEQLPVHQLSRIKLTDSVFETSVLDYDWLVGLLEKNPNAVRHIVLTEKDDQRENKRVVLTADTAELQKFVLKHLNNTNAWTSEKQMRMRQRTQ